MIRIIRDGFDNLDYDVRGIVSSFYPGKEIVFEEGCPASPTPEQETVLHLGEILSDPTKAKNELRKELYTHLSKRTGRELPWGILIGVRPTKLTMAAIESGMSEDEAAELMRREYFVSGGKASLAAGISARELGIIRTLRNETRETPEQSHENDITAAGGQRGYSLYAGIPFCPTTCLYCSFTSYPISKWRHRVGDYLDALFRELDWTADRFAARPCHSVYIGGGTPTSLDAADLDRLLGRIRDRIDFGPVREFTVEAGRPDSITREKLLVMRDHGVTRISINPQTMNDASLRLIGRSHRSAEIVEKYMMARELGFDNINMDIILGLPGERAEDVARTMEALAALRPDSLTVHALAVKRASRLKMEAAGAVMPGYSDEESARMMEIAVSGAESMGLAPYYLYRQKNMAGSLENVGFAAPGKEGIYNIVIIEETESIVALGAGTVTKNVDKGPKNITRCDCAKEVDDYISRIDEMIRRKEELFAR
ncbi:MAG: coproporphyrinogen dehydrogenase HemZ [Lachnospiraceae bacterium]|nr:coproporphyrinogen dehydrogenase HemZ [Lachnospiraceae bacterium]